MVAPAFGPGWEDLGVANRVRTSPTKLATPLVGASNVVSGWNQDCLVRQYVSDAIDAQTITGTVKGIIRAKESAATMDGFAQLLIKVVSNDGATVRGTLLALNTSFGAELATAYPNRKFPS